MNSPTPADTFLREAEDLLAQIEETALDIRPGEEPGEAVHRLFRAFHTIKGSGAMFGYDAVAGFTHHVETVLDRVREGALPMSPELLDLLLAARDHIAALLDPVRSSEPATLAAGGPLVAAFHDLLPPETTSTPPAASVVPAPAAGRAQPYRIRFRPPANLMVAGTNPRTLLDELRSLGDCTVRADLTRLPALEQLQPDQCHLGWEIDLTTDRGPDAIRDVFIFVEDGGELVIEALAAASVAPAALAEPSSPPLSPPAPAVSLPATGVPARASVSSPLAPKPRDAAIRVGSERLDQLVALVGELVMNQSRLSQVSARADHPDLTSPVEELERLVAELRDSVLGIRMMPIGTTFGRFKRLVHDLSSQLGKEIDLVTEGAETELDKTVLDQLGDPLVHLIRNSLDHGVEPPEVRLRAGKSRRGSIRLLARHTGSNVVITIEDDGHGLDTAAIRAKAHEKGLIASDANLSPSEIFQLIFLPGFSTAKQVTSVSGRGVGMDVVKRQIEALRGTIQIASEPGRGATIALTLPLTLAIIEGLLVEVGGDRFILPMASVLETVELVGAERTRNNGRNVVTVRGELVPYLRLRGVFATAGDDLAIEKVVIVRHNHERVGLVVDRVLGSHQTVIQSLGRFYRGVEVVSGATIMGDGRVALILDLAGLIRTDARRTDRSTPLPSAA